MTNTTKKLELAKQISEFSKGFSLVESSMSHVTEKGNALNGIINGDNEVTKSYINCFSFSLEDEESELSMFSEAFEEYVDAPFVPLSPEDMIKFDEYEACILGFAIAKQSLQRIATLCTEDAELKKELLEFDPQSLESEEEYGTYNPFQLYGVEEYKENFNHFKEAYLAELRQIIGEETFLKIEETVNPYLKETDMRKFTNQYY